MIKKIEIIKNTEKYGVPANTIDKDWVLSHILGGLYSGELKSDLIFKGGTCLRKCYFDGYRFSEDLDFTLSKEYSIKEIEKEVNIALELINKHTDILFQKPKVKKNYFQDKFVGIKIIIPFWGANHKGIPTNREWFTKFVLDITSNEIISLAPLDKCILHPYSDNLLSNSLKSYSLEEIFSEKMRSLLQRNYTAPRDYYDLWSIIRKHTFKEWPLIKETIKAKCKFKNVTFESLESFFLDENVKNVIKAWDSSLTNHLRETPDPDKVISELYQYLSKLLKF